MTTTAQYWFDYFAGADWLTVKDVLDAIQRAGDYFGEEVHAEMRAAAEHFAAGLPRPA